MANRNVRLTNSSTLRTPWSNCQDHGVRSVQQQLSVNNTKVRLNSVTHFGKLLGLAVGTVGLLSDGSNSIPFPKARSLFLCPARLSNKPISCSRSMMKGSLLTVTSHTQALRTHPQAEVGPLSLTLSSLVLSSSSLSICFPIRLVGVSVAPADYTSLTTGRLQHSLSQKYCSFILLCGYCLLVSSYLGCLCIGQSRIQ